jgi:hypothetical protein
MLKVLVLGFALCFSVLLPLAILSLRRTVRLQRQSVILDLQHMFHARSLNGHGEGIVPSFEFVRNKYFPQFVEFDVVKTRMYDRADKAQQGAVKRALLRAFSAFSFALCSLPLVLLSFVFSLFAFSLIVAGAWPAEMANVLPIFQHYPNLSLPPEYRAMPWVFVVAFLGGYLFAVRSLLRAVNNFDLSPGSFLSAALHLLVGVVTAVVIVAGGVKLAAVGEVGMAGQAAISASIAAAFLFGYVPDLGLRTLYRASRLRLFKSEDQDIYRIFQATPVEVVDGIDTEIRNRLAEFNILSVQNLATANPIMLFVETPFGIYQSIDWVGQAQLFAAVGPETVRRLWKLGIRTIFDLEKAALVQGYTTPQLRQAVGLALLAGADEATRRRLGPPDGPFDDASVRALVENKVDDLHVHRLRQIANRIEAHLGEENRRFGAGPPQPPANDSATKPPAGGGARPPANGAGLPNGAAAEGPDGARRVG